MSSPKRGEIWLANLNPGRGSEAGKTCPVLVVQSQALLEANHPSTLVLPLTTNLIDDCEPLRVRIAAQANLKQTSDLLVDQLRALDNRRFVQGGPLLACSQKAMEKIGECMRQVLDLDIGS